MTGKCVGKTQPRVRIQSSPPLSLEGLLLIPNLQQISTAARTSACRIEFVTADAAGGARVFPLDQPGVGLVIIATTNVYSATGHLGHYRILSEEHDFLL
jgi:hypothetical protein